MAYNPEWSAWYSMVARCTKPHPDYGGRGIRVCERWLIFETFLADLGPRPSPKHSLDRRDVNGNYEPGNARWATREEQARNQRNNRLVTIGSETRPAVEWAEKSGLPLATIYNRLNAGWPASRLLSPTQRKPRGGGPQTPERVAWRNMGQRCLNLKHPAWPNYGGRGITVCARWMFFDAFLEDMGPRPSSTHSLDRIDGNGPYSPENCRWATRTEQNRNTRGALMLTLGEETLNLSAWAERLHVNPETIRSRLRSGQSVERALTF